ncbi:MAG: Na+/H+ antiporter subunit C [Pseudomonadota bacterium]
MEPALSVVIGILVACGAYLMMSSSLIRFLFGLTVISNAINLMIFAAGRLTYGIPPLVPEGAKTVDGNVANALPQALILTAIVIGFGLLVFALSLVLRAYMTFGTADSRRIREAEPEHFGAAPAEAPGPAPVSGDR